ncbi:MAG: 4Fe-4S dicluster domain-containing protein [Nitrospirota bacterium]
MRVIDRSALDRLLEALRRQGYQLIGPTLRDGAILFDEIRTTADLPEGWTEEQEGGTYRLKRRPDRALFGYAVGPHSWKKYLHPPVRRLWQAQRRDGALEFIPEPESAVRYAFIAARACDLQAIAVQDRVFLEGRVVDPSYQARREGAFVIAVNCGQAGGTCFCVSMGTGPKAARGFDLALTEVVDGGRHEFIVEVGSERGERLLRESPGRAAAEEDRAAAARIVEETARHMGRTMEAAGIKELLYRNYDHPRWDNVAARCLTCGNCTMVCPTCFCTTVDEVTDLTGEHAERWQKWDSCFTMDFSYIHGPGSVRSSTKARYRQWMTHKLATWWDQFSYSGCVGCGRCITWCPVAIDITEEVRAIRDSEKSGG